MENDENIIKYLPELQQYCMISNIEKIEKMKVCPKKHIKGWL